MSIAGCAATTARQSMFGLSARDAEAGAALAVRTQPAQPAPTTNGAEPHATSQGSQQSGQGNVTGQIDAGGWKGIEYSTAVPVGQVILMALMLLFSHRREMTRIKQNGKDDFQAFRLSGCPGQAASTRPDSLTAEQSNSPR